MDRATPFPQFADTDLAARIERAATRFMTESANAVAHRRPGDDVMVRALAGGVAVYTGPESPLNKVAGVGFDGALEAEQLKAIESEYARRGSPVQFELSNLADASIAPFLTRRGYVLLGFENVLGVRLPRESAAAERHNAGAAIDVRRCQETEFDHWIDIMVTGFATPDTQGVPTHEYFPRDVIERVMRDMTSGAGLVGYVAQIDGILAGGAGVRVCDAIAHFCGAATLPRFRRRGVQTALLAHRLHEASQLGCDLAVITTLPGSKSHQNAARHGFELLYTRAILVRQCEGGPDQGTAST